MIDFLYNIIIFPLIQIIETAFSIFYRISRDKVIAIIGVSFAVTVCTMPLYFIAEKWQKAEREIMKAMSPMIKTIKSAFKGDERFMILSEYYRQNHYHPIYALRNSFGILIQIPFFLAAYIYLSNLDYIKNTSFLFISDLGSPDSFLTIGTFTLNILPVLMTLINCCSGLLYTKDLPIREKLQTFGMALIFLVVLYNSPSGLVLYWTMNNIFSLLKNILVRTKHAKKIIYFFLCACALMAIIRFIPLGFSPKRLFVMSFLSLIFFTPLFIKLFNITIQKVKSKFAIQQSLLSDNKTFFLSAIILLLLCGFVIPSALISSSVQEFSYLDSYTIPLPFLFTVFIQALGIFIFWPFIIFFLFPQKTKRYITLILSLISVIALLNVFIFPGDYGYLTTSFIFSNPDTFESKYQIIFLSSIVTVLVLFIAAYLLLSKRTVIFRSFQLIIVITLAMTGILSSKKIIDDFNIYTVQRVQLEKSGSNFNEANDLEPVFKLSKTGKNIVVLMIDTAISGYAPQIFAEKPELLSSYSGFTYYPNSVSFGGHTRIGAPIVFGGYEYSPANIQKNRSFALQKHNEALMMMPRIFTDNGYKATVTDPSFANYSWKADLSIYKPFPQINAQNIVGNYTDIWLRGHPDLKIVSIPDILEKLLIRFSMLKISPPVFRIFIYDMGNWLTAGSNHTNNQLSLDTLDNYTTLALFPEITEITESNINTYTAITNDLPHYPAFLQYPDYIPASEVTNNGNGPFANEQKYHAIMAALMLFGKWLDYMQEQGVYDNTRIIITADHGSNANINYPGNNILPDGNYLARYHVLLLVKDFNSRGELLTDNSFMSNADTPSLAMKGLIENPVNPFSGNPVIAEKENGITLTTSSQLQFTLKNDQWLHVKDDIFDLSNWKQVTKE